MVNDDGRLRGRVPFERWLIKPSSQPVQPAFSSRSEPHRPRREKSLLAGFGDMKRRGLASPDLADALALNLPIRWRPTTMAGSSPEAPPPIEVRPFQQAWSAGAVRWHAPAVPPIASLLSLSLTEADQRVGACTASYVATISYTPSRIGPSPQKNYFPLSHSRKV